LLVDTTTDFQINNHTFRAVPYVATGRFDEAVGDLTGLSAVFSHQQFRGSRYNNLVDETGDIWSAAIPCINGHIHDFQINGNVICVGSSRQSSYRDVIDKTVSLFIFGDNGKYEHQRLSIPLDILVQIRIGADEFHTWQPPPNSIVTLIVRGTFAENNPHRLHHPKWPNVTVTFEDLIEEYVPQTHQYEGKAPTFTTIFEQKIQHNPDYIALYMAYKQHGTSRV
jgi:hypothetical protein